MRLKFWRALAHLSFVHVTRRRAVKCAAGTFSVQVVVLSRRALADREGSLRVGDRGLSAKGIRKGRPETNRKRVFFFNFVSSSSSNCGVEPFFVAIVV